VQYPTVVTPGETIQVLTLAVAKSAADVDTLNAYVYYSDGSALHQVTSATLVGGQDVVAGNEFNTTMPVAIPDGMPRTSLFATLTESIKVNYETSYANSQYYDENGYYCGYYSYNNEHDCYYYPYYSTYPQYSYVLTSDTGISPLSYVNATTPEYTALLSQYQDQQQQLTQAQAQNQNLQQQVNQQDQQLIQLQNQVQQLQQEKQNQQNALSQTNSNNSNLSSQLSSESTMNRNLIYLALAFGAVAILAILLGSRSGRPKRTQSVNPYAANYAPPKNETQ
jgi:preprotein translocase subunit SecG